MPAFSAYCLEGAKRSQRCYAGRPATRADVVKKMKQLNVQLDNLCQVHQ